MEVKPTYQPPVQEEPKKGFLHFLTQVLAFFLIPFRFTHDMFKLLKEDNIKISTFKAWHKKQKRINARQRRFSDEF